MADPLPAGVAALKDEHDALTLALDPFLHRHQLGLEPDELGLVDGPSSVARSSPSHHRGRPGRMPPARHVIIRNVARGLTPRG
jgi:hypothetical protein